MVAGVTGLFLRYANVPLAPIVIGFILGTPLEENLRKGLIVTQMQPLKFLESPIAVGFFAATLLVMFWPLIKKVLPVKPSCK